MLNEFLFSTTMKILRMTMEKISQLDYRLCVRLSLPIKLGSELSKSVLFSIGEIG
jgi:hypothetical protein